MEWLDYDCTTAYDTPRERMVFVYYCSQWRLK